MRATSPQRVGVRNGHPIHGAYAPRNPFIMREKIQGALNSQAQGNLEVAYTPTGQYGGPTGSNNGLSLSAISTMQQSYIRLLEGIIPQQEYLLRQFYEDIYTYDPIAGSAVDLMATLPFSSFSVVGMEEGQASVYEEAVSRLDLQRLFPLITVDYLTKGVFVGSLIFRRDVKQFIDVFPFLLGECRFENVPLLTKDPVIKVVTGDRINAFLSSTTSHVVRIRNRLSQSFLGALRSGTALLDPVTTLYVPRRPTWNEPFTSWYRRIVPLYLIEKMLYRGTHSEASRRQRGSMHIEVGTDTWEPTPEELTAAVGLFQQADFDPLGAIIATRNGVNLSEFRQAGDFWKYTDLVGDTTQLKLRALGISDAFLSGEATWTNQEIAINVFLDHLKAYRESMTDRVLYKKLFPLVSITHGFFKKKGPGVQTTGDLSSKAAVQDMLENPHNLVIPQVHWHKELDPNTGPQTIQTYETLMEAGVPIPLRVLAAAGGLNLTSLMAERDSDLAVRKALGVPSNPLENQGGPPGNTEGASVLGSINPPNILNRDFNKGEYHEDARMSKSGKVKHYIPDAADAEGQARRAFERAMHNLSDPEYRNNLRSRINDRLRGE